jgi:hypothetical protein
MLLAPYQFNFIINNNRHIIQHIGQHNFCRYLRISIACIISTSINNPMYNCIYFR